MGSVPKEIAEVTRIDSWFLNNMKQICDLEEEIQRFGLDGRGLEKLPATLLRQAKEWGYSDVQLAHLLGSNEIDLRARRKALGIRPTFKLVDTCAAEFEAYTPYYYSTYDRGDDEVLPSDRRKVLILGGGPNRIGQAGPTASARELSAFALRSEEYETIMVNCNPETVSTDYDTSDKLYFEPLTLEDVLNIVAAEKPDGVIVQFGGQTPLNLAVPLARHNVPIIGTSPDSIDRAEDRKRFTAVLNKLGLQQPANATATSADEAVQKARALGFPVLVRPSYVLYSLNIWRIDDIPENIQVPEVTNYLREKYEPTENLGSAMILRRRES
jgi:carbamoyl-phosphate synthase large subunit